MAISNTLTRVVLEPASQAFVEATAVPPFLYELTPDEARKVLDDVQAAPIEKLPVEERWTTVPAEVGEVRVRIVRPEAAFYVMFGVDGMTDSLAFAKRMVHEAHVGLAPGSAFGPGGARSKMTMRPGVQ